MLIVEGPDAAGKSTLCRKLTESLSGRGYVYSHFSRLPEAFDRYWGYLERASRRVVQDRFHLSEIVYAAARGDETRLDPETYRLVDARLRLLGAFTVLVVADTDLIASRWDESQMYGKKVTAEAAKLFGSLAESFPAYRPDIDLTITCSTGKPYPDDDDLESIRYAYLLRQDAVESMTWRYRPCLGELK